LDLDRLVPLTTRDGHHYLVKFSLMTGIIDLPDTINVQIVDLVVSLINGDGINNASTLFHIAGIIKEYLDNNDVVLYCYCDRGGILKSEKRSSMSPEEFRSLLFSAMFNKKAGDNYINHPIIIEDNVYGAHYIHLISTRKNQGQIEMIENELLKFKK